MDPVALPLAPTPPPVIDYARQARIAEVVDSVGPTFSMFNIVALIIIALTAFFLYRRYKDKHATERAHMVRPSPIIDSPPVAAVVVDEVKED
jgi:hypothetical protein